MVWASLQVLSLHTLGVQHIHNLNHQWVDEQLDGVHKFFTYYKTGMIATADTMETIR